VNINRRGWPIIASLLIGCSCAHAQALQVDCGGGGPIFSINAALNAVDRFASGVPITISVSGACPENLMSGDFDRLTIAGNPGASISDASNAARDVIALDNSRLTSFELPAQELPAARHHHYKLIKVGTFGGPLNHLSTHDYLNSTYIGASQDLNNAGTLTGWADTSAPDPNASVNPGFCFNPPAADGICYVSHAFVSRNGDLKDLGTLRNGPSSATTWVSANGLVAGVSQNGEFDPQASPPGFPENRAVLWRDGTIIDLGVLPDPEGGYESGAEAVNSRGQVVGWALNRVPDPYGMNYSSPLYNWYEPIEPYQERAFLWENGVMHDLGTLGTGTDAYAMAINERGQVIGISYTSSTPNQAATVCSSEQAVPEPIPTQDPFLWENGTMIDLGTLGGVCGFPIWINNSGEVVGFSDLSGDQESHPFLWTKAEGMQDLGTLGGSSGGATMINEYGDVVGGSDLAGDSEQDAFLWDGVMHDLGSIDGCAAALAINVHRQVVGNTGSGCANIGFLWEGGPMVDLNTLVSSSSGLSVVAALEINDRGEIAGAGLDANNNLYAILLIPCDDDHAGIEGCDYSWMDVRTVANSATSANASHATQAAWRIGIAGHRRGIWDLRLPPR
jgi:probable HAF family extracellular repeat protein